MKVSKLRGLAPVLLFVPAGLKPHDKLLNETNFLILSLVYDPKKLSEKLKVHPQTPAVLIKGQGLFVWGKDLNECIFR